MSDIQKLITTGKIARECVVHGVKIVLSTPGMDRLKDDQGKPEVRFANLAEFVDKVGDTDVITPEAKAEFAATFPKMQPGFVAGLAVACNEMTEEQNAIIKGMFSTKKS
jgi:hypothetical protein